MSHNMKFDQEAFRKGLDEILAFAPLRDAFARVFASKSSVLKSYPLRKISSRTQSSSDERGRKDS